MAVRGLTWLATRTSEIERMQAFVTSVLQIEPAETEPGRLTYELDNGDFFEVFGEKHDGGGHPVPGPIGAFRVDDALAAHARAIDAGLSPTPCRKDEPWTWFYVVAPDGAYYEILSREGVA